MLIDNAEIEKAKAKLGNKNATLMAEMLELEDFDEKNLKSLCPYHDEDTASFIYNPKNYTFKCFGCGRSVDILDVLMETQSLSFVEAVEKLFELADISYSFGEHHVQTKREYRYPHEEPLNDRTHVIEYLGKRGISKSVIDYLDIREDSHENCVFNYYDTNDVLELVKYRPSHTIDKSKKELKSWCQAGADTTPLLFNMNRINTTKPLLVLEGECDCASAIEAGYLNSVSVPLGAQNLHWIEENWDWLNQFESIIVWADNDEPGEKMRQECLYRLGTWRTKFITTPQYFERPNGKKIPLKDCNECLQVGGKEYVMNLIASAKDMPVTSVIDYANIEDIDVMDMDGIETGIKPLDDELIKLFYSHVLIVTGRPGSGKTSLIDQMIGNALDKDVPTFLFSKEMPERITANWLNSILAGQRNMEQRTNKDGQSFYIVPTATKKEIQKYYEKKLYIYRDDEPNDEKSVLTSVENCIRRYGCKFIVLDNLMMIDLASNDENMNSAQTEFINSLIKMAAKFNVAILLCAHPRKTMDMQSSVGMYDISGSSNLINLAMRSIALRRVSKKEQSDPSSKWGKYNVVLTILKDRVLGRSDIDIGLYYDNVSRRFYTNYDEFDYQYGWDKKQYTSKLPYDKDDSFPDK